ncbi:TRIM2_3 [Mytilus edulis]|uniref:TRIM2_3 n=1 Tax=Mytilus edulis TaxID=6550 RepID=A0A8S3UTK8_MYTED|nr:TRIM2_3 [Mytilus edulis]
MSKIMQRRLADNIASDHLSCPICQDPFQDPKLLPCDHTLCCECLTQLIHSSRRYNKFSCPVDRREITAPSYNISAEEWANSFPTDELAIVLLQAVAGDVTTQGKSKNAILCSEHPHNVCDFFCFGCYQIICSECAVEHHRSTECNCKKFKNCADLAREKLGDASDEIESLICHGQEIVTKEIEKDQLLSQSRQQIKDTVLRLKSIVYNFEKMVNRKCLDILSKVESVVNVEELQKKTEEIVKDLKRVRDEIEYVKSQTSTKDMLTVLSNVPENLQKNTDRFNSLGVSDDPIEIKLELNETFLNLCDKLVDQPIGSVHVVRADKLYFEDTEATVCNQRIKFSSNVLPSRALELEPFLQIKDEPSGLEKNNSARFTGLTLHGHSIIAVDNSNFKVKRFRDTIKDSFIDEIAIPGAYDITNIHDNDDLLVTSPGTQSRLFRLSTYKSLSIMSETVTDKAYYDISRLPDSAFAVICHSRPSSAFKKRANFDWSRGVTSHIDIINVDGNVLKHFSESFLCEPTEFGDPFIMPLKSMCCLPNGTIVVSIETKTNSFISCIKQNGRVKWTYNLNDTSEGVSFYDGKIYVFLRESQVVRVLSIEGGLKPTSTFKLPHYIGDGSSLLVVRNLLTVVDKTSSIKLYKLQ